MLTLRRPDDWHLHLRDADMLHAVLPATTATFGRALIMPNLVPPVTTVASAVAYRARIVEALPPDSTFEPLLTAYLTDHTDPDEIVRGVDQGAFVAVKLYPAHATTHSADGVTDVDSVMPVLERMAAHDIPLCVHGEVTDRSVDVFDREAVFIDQVLAPLVVRLPTLRVVLEHVTTAAGVAFARSKPQVAATLTAHHLWWNRNALFDGGLRPHAYCLPVLKRESDRLALREAATSGDPSFFAGTDSAPHAVHRKEADCGCAGVFSAPTAMAAYAQVFDEHDALDRLEAFTSEHGARFYGVPLNAGTVTLHRREHTPAERMAGPDGQSLRVFLGGERLQWATAPSWEPQRRTAVQ